MASPGFDYRRYLAAKKTVDDRALNGHVRRSLLAALAAWKHPVPLKVLEVGAGLGAMVERWLEWGAFPLAEYTAIDLERSHIREARWRLPLWAAQRDFQTEEAAGGFIITGHGMQLHLRLQAGDLFDFLERMRGRVSWDLLLAHAVLDLVDLSDAVPRLLMALREGGLFYFTLNFDGASQFLPETQPEIDARIWACYHQTMRHRNKEGKLWDGARTGLSLFHHLPMAGGEILAAGSSDWMVFPAPAGYPGDEAFFLHSILQTIEAAVQGHPDLASGEMEQWLAARRAQIEARELIFVAHHLDFFGRKGGLSGG